tara:strand:+ start:5194 stop:6684 length:1491 start_codon:yes stop_codon:yes gene_type:complete
MDNLKKRYTAKLISNSSGAIFTFLSVAFLARSLGPSEFGLFQYLKVFFEKIIQFLLVGISGLFPKLSQKPENINLIIFSIIYFLASSLCIILFSILIIFFNKNEIFFSTASTNTTYLVLLLVIFLTFIEKTREVMDAWVMTVSSEIIILLMKLSLLILTGLIFYYEVNSLNIYLGFHNLLLIIIIILFFRLALKKIRFQINSFSLNETAIDLKNFALPLFYANTFSIFVSLGERWMLQFFAGSIEQAYFSLGYQFTFVIILLTGAFTPLLLREYAAAHELTNYKKQKELFNDYLPLFYFLTSVVAGFLSVHSDFLVQLIGGKEYSDASLVVSILILSAVHQTYGQLGGVYLLATNRSRAYAIIQSSILPVNIVLSFIFIAPTNLYGFSLGAIGLAFSLLISQILYSNILIIYNAKIIGVNYLLLLLHQIIVLLVPIIIAYFIKIVFSIYILNSYLLFFVSGVVYLIIIILLLYLFPALILYSRKKIKISAKKLIKL